MGRAIERDEPARHSFAKSRNNSAKKSDESCSQEGSSAQHARATECHEGLRSRKKAQSRRDIECALLELVLERGYERVTVEDACQRAGVSKKTFFNYFPSKDAAIRGRFDAIPTVEELKGLLSSGSEENYIDMIAHAIQMDLVDSDEEDAHVRELRQAVLAKNPELLFRGHKDVADMQANVAAALNSYLTEHPERRLLPDAELAIEILTSISALASIMRIRLVMSIRGGCVPDAAQSRAMLDCVVGKGL